MDSGTIGARSEHGIKPLVVLVVIGLTIVAPATATVAAQNSDPNAVEPRSTAGTQASASFVVSNFQGPSQANVGQSVKASAVIKNKGDKSGTERIEYRIAGEVVASKKVSLKSKESVTITLKGTVPSVATGTYSQGMFVGSGENGATANIIIGNPSAKFEVISLTAPSTASIGSDISATATVMNSGDAKGTETFQYRIGSTVVSSVKKTIDPGKKASLTFDGTVPNVGVGEQLQGVFVGNTNNGLTKSITLDSNRPAFSVDSFQAPSRATVNDSVTATMSIRNSGNASGTATVEYRINNKVIGSKQVTLAPGKSQTISISGLVPDLKSGTYKQSATIRDSTSRLEANIVIQAEPSAYFSVSRLDAPKSAIANDDITASATITNSGTQKATVPVEYRIGGNVIKRVQVELGPSKSKTIEFTGVVPKLSKGTYTQGVFIDNTDRGQTSSLQLRSGTLFQINNFVGPPAAQIGDQISVQATVRNVGDTAGSRTVQFSIGDLKIAEQTVKLNPEKSQTVTLTGTVPSVKPGTYRQSVSVNGEGPSSKITLRAKPRPSISVVSFGGPAQGTGGQPLQASARVQNSGDAAGTVTFEYRLDGIVLSSKQVTLDPGESRQLEFEAVAPNLDTGTYTQGVFISGTNQGASSQIRHTKGQARFSVANLQGPAEATIGDQISVQAAITNTGTAAGEMEIQYRVNGDVIATKNVKVAAGDTTTVTFDVTVPDKSPRTYRHGVFVGSSSQGQTSSLVIAARQTPKPKTVIKTKVVEKTVVKTVRKTDAPGLDGFGIPVALIALMATALVALRRRNR